MRLSKFLSLVAGASLALLSASVVAQSGFPNKPIRLVVPFAPGGTTDLLARAVGQKMGEGLGQPLVIENKPGAGGNIGADSVAKSAPDGYTLLLGTPGPLAINASLFKSMPFNPERDLAPVGQLINIQAVVITMPSSPWKSLRDVAAQAKASDGVAYGSAGNGTTPHLAAELYASVAGIDLQHIPYKGDAPALTDLLGGHIKLMFANLAGVIGPLREGKVRALAVTGASRSKALPDVPTIAEAGAPGYAVTAWAGLFVPAGTPAGVVNRLNAELNRALATPEVNERMALLQAEIAASTPEQLAALVRTERQRWARIITERGIKLD
ncbi:MAG: tripartite tricarboxylate transporter substrate binding protein [Betaproteobacteria bacterium]|nr:tripartite tricarboxylate transporter substrate binding protein [Betaproteobacteria bacterium]NCA23254.1 tripartite tricarboxylate transporter substrate binding protein [Betaproteobacteria bacterium]NDE53288.1 tripartite tricarboxylate transporter substrate binding protein [Actinomycetota bacterium]